MSHSTSNAVLAFSDMRDPWLGADVGGLRLEEQIGRGGFGVVYRAVEEKTQRMFAVKMMHWHVTHAGMIQRFHREAVTLQKLDHPHIVRLKDFGILTGHGLYLVMEFLEGKSINQCMKDNESFPIRRLKGIVQALCGALDYIHKRGLVHRDLKPGNLFLVGPPSQEQLKLIDFGIVSLRENQEKLTETGAFLGTARYGSPEQINGSDALSGRSDLYSLAVILFVLLTKRHPFRGKTDLETAFLHLNQPPPTLTEASSTRAWAPELESFFQRALAKKPGDRPVDALAFSEECLDALQAQQELDFEDTMLTAKEPSRQDFGSVWRDDEESHTLPGEFLLPVESPVTSQSSEGQQQTPAAGHLPAAISLAEPVGTWRMLLEGSPSLPAEHHRTWLDPQSPVSVQSEPKGEPRKLWFWLVGGLIVLSALFGGWAGWLFWRASQESAEGALPQRRIQPRKRTDIPQKTRPVPGKKRNPAIAPPSRPRINWSARAYAAPVECRVLAKGVRRRFHWIYAEVTPTQGAGVQWRFRECPGCRAYRLQGGGWCLGAFLTDKHVHIKLQMTGYQSCILSVASDDQRLRLQLKRAKEQPLAPTLNGCRR